jgi:putative flippase GtrA
MSQSSTRSQLSRFFLVGSSTALIDFVVYKALLFLMPSSFAKTISFLSGAIYAYQFNRLWTFQAGRSTLPQALKFGLIYGTNLGVNVGANASMLSLLPLVYPWRLDLAFLMATGISAALNFIGMKWLAFAPRNR